MGLGVIRPGLTFWGLPETSSLGIDIRRRTGRERGGGGADLDIKSKIRANRFQREKMKMTTENTV